LNFDFAPNYSQLQQPRQQVIQMNSTTLQFSSVGKANFKQLHLGLKFNFASIIERLKDYLSHYQFAQAQNIYELRRKREIQARHQDILQQLPMEEKLRLGLYHLMR